MAVRFIKLFVFKLKYNKYVFHTYQIWKSVDRKDFNKTFVDVSDPLANIIRPYGYKALIYKTARLSNDIHQLLRMLNRILKFYVTLDIIISAINFLQYLFLS